MSKEMDREKQINEIAKIIARRSMAFRNPNVAFMTTARKTADSIYNAGYCKKIEIAKEIFDDIESKLLNHVGDYHGCYHKTFDELKRKYTDCE
mgnify:CR=1 FL=1